MLMVAANKTTPACVRRLESYGSFNATGTQIAFSISRKSRANVADASDRPSRGQLTCGCQAGRDHPDQDEDAAKSDGALIDEGTDQ